MRKKALRTAKEVAAGEVAQIEEGNEDVDEAKQDASVEMVTNHNHLKAGRPSSQAWTATHH